MRAVYRDKPINLNKKNLNVFEPDYIYNVGAPVIQECMRVDILGDTFVSFKRKMFYFYYSYTHTYLPTNSVKLQRLLLYFLPFKKISIGVWVINNWSHNYYHWISEILPKVLVAMSALEEDVPILLPDHFKRFMYVEESLKLMGVKYLFYSTRRRLSVSKLYVPTLCVDPGNHDNTLISSIRALYQFDCGVNRSRRIFISREKAEKRKITNQNEVNELLISLGFEIIICEDHTFIDQVKIFNSAFCLISLHGAGLTNMVFMRENSSVLELRNEKDKDVNCYYRLSTCLNIDYYYLMCRSESTDARNGNVYVDIKSLKSIAINMINARR